MKVISLPGRAAIKCRGYWDGRSSYIKEKKAIYIADGIIITEKKETASSFTCYDYGEYFLMPALIDCHVHLRMPSGGAVPEKKAAQYLAAGIFAVRDGGHRKGFLPDLYPLKVQQAGYAVYKKGYYGSAIGIGAGSLYEALQTVDMLAEKGASQIKVAASGIFSFSRYGETGHASFSVEELKEIIARAGSHNLPVMVHASGDEGVRRALQAGAATIEHGYFMSRKTLKEMADCGTFWIPTLIPAAVQLSDKKLYIQHTPAERSVIAQTLHRHMELVAEGAGLGVRIAAGTDAGAPGVEHGSSLFRELRLLKEAGFSTVQALRAATSVAAAACGLKKTGKLAAGQKAFLLAVPGNPLENIDVLQKPIALFLPARDRKDKGRQYS